MVENIHRCCECGLIYRQPRRVYDLSSYSPKTCGYRPFQPDQLTEKKKGIFKRYLHDLERFRKTNRILDVGPGEGYFANLCCAHGWEVWGVDPVAEYSTGAHQEKRLHLVHGSFLDMSFEDNFFDVITFFNVLEHLDDPNSAVKKSFKIVRKGGAVIVRSPNTTIHLAFKRLINSLKRLWKPLGAWDPFVIHQYGFNQKTMRKYFSASSFERPLKGNSSFARALSIVAIKA